MKFVLYDQSVEPTVVSGVRTYTAKTTDVEYKFNKTFTISLNMINQLFDIKGKFYNFAYTR